MRRTKHDGTWTAKAALFLTVACLALPFLLPATGHTDGDPTGSSAARPTLPPSAPQVAGSDPTPDNPPGQSPTFSGVYLLDGGAVIAALGYSGFAGVWYGVGANGTQIFADGLWCLLWGTTNAVSTVTLTVDVRGATPVVQEVTVAPRPAEEYVFLPTGDRLAWTDVAVHLNTQTWTGQMSVPASLIPVADLDLGGLDLLVMAILSEFIVGATIATAAARWAMRRAGYAPPFRTIVWGHVFLGSLFLVIFADYSVVAQTFAGWSPFVYALPLVGMWWLTSLSASDHSHKREVLQPTQVGGDLAFRRYLLRMVRTADGRLAYAKESWGQFWARFWRHYVFVGEGMSEAAPAFVAPVENLESPTGTRFGRKRHSVARAVLPETNPNARRDRFEVANAQDDDVAGLMLLKPGPPLRLEYPHLTFARQVPARPAEFNPDGSIRRRERPAHVGLGWPHYAPGAAEEAQFESIHAKEGVAAIFEWLSKMDLARMKGEYATAYAVLRAEFETRVRAEVESTLAAIHSFLGRSWSDVRPDEAEAEAERGPFATRSKPRRPTATAGQVPT